MTDHTTPMQSGWICPNCHQFVPVNTTHACNPNLVFFTANVPPAYVTPDPALVSRIARLEEEAASLEKALTDVLLRLRKLEAGRAALGAADAVEP